MKTKSQYLNNLYHDLFSNSPQTVSIDIPSGMGTGYISQTTTKQGAILSDWRMNYLSDMNVQGVNDEEYIQIIFCMNEGVSWSIANDTHAVSIQKGESCFYRGHGQTEYLSYGKNSDFVFKNIKLPVSYFQKILREHFEDSEIIAYERKLLNEISKITVTPYMERIWAEMKDFEQYQGGLGCLFLESKTLEMLSVYLSEVLEIGILVCGEASISRTDRGSILEAKRIIDAQLAFAPSCEALAKKTNLSTSKLMRGFNAMFGNSIHAYIIEQRLEKAAGLLLESDLNVSEIAILVGYSKPSNFSAAFKKKYGVVPKGYKIQKALPSEIIIDFG